MLGNCFHAITAACQICNPFVRHTVCNILLAPTYFWFTILLWCTHMIYGVHVHIKHCTYHLWVLWLLQVRHQQMFLLFGTAQKCLMLAVKLWSPHRSSLENNNNKSCIFYFFLPPGARTLSHERIIAEYWGSRYILERCVDMCPFCATMNILVNKTVYFVEHNFI